MDRDTLKLKQEDIREINITNRMREVAHKFAKQLGVLKNSITRGQGNVIGFLGETMVSKYLKVVHRQSYDYDFVLPNGETIDVKTKRTSVKPKVVYDCSVSNYNTKQDCDYYVFARVLEDHTKGWLLGYYPKKEFFKDASLIKKGDTDPSNGYTARSDHWNIKIHQLRNIEKLIEKSS